MTEKKLTPQREKFCIEFVKCNCATEAYRLAFNVKPTTKPETTQANASRLMANSMVVARVAELRKELAEKELWTREQSLKALMGCLPTEVTQDGSIKAKSTAEIVAVIKELNAMQGFNAPQKNEHTGKDGRPLIVRIIDDVPEC